MLEVSTKSREVARKKTHLKFSHPGQNVAWVVVSRIFEIFTPKIGEDEPILTSIFFSRGWNYLLVNLQEKHTKWIFVCSTYIYIVIVYRVQTNRCQRMDVFLVGGGGVVEDEVATWCWMFVVLWFKLIFNTVTTQLNIWDMWKNLPYKDIEHDMTYIFIIIHMHPGKLTWNPKMEVWKITFVFNWVIFRFHVNFPGSV